MMEDAQSATGFGGQLGGTNTGAAFSLSADLGKITSWSNKWNMSFNPDKSHTLTMSLRKDRLEKLPICFLNNSLKAFVQASGSHYLP